VRIPLSGVRGYYAVDHGIFGDTTSDVCGWGVLRNEMLHRGAITSPVADMKGAINEVLFPSDARSHAASIAKLYQAIQEEQVRSEFYVRRRRLTGTLVNLELKGRAQVK